MALKNLLKNLKATDQENAYLLCVIKLAIPVKEAADAARITEACADYAGCFMAEKRAGEVTAICIEKVMRDLSRYLEKVAKEGLLIVDET